MDPAASPLPTPPIPGSKYRPLFDFLSRQPGLEVVLSFRAIEAMIKRLLPKAAGEPHWWGVGGRASDSWRAAGFQAQLRAGQDEVVFHRRPPAALGGACDISTDGPLAGGPRLGDG